MSEVAPDNESRMSKVIAPVVQSVTENNEESGKKLPCEHENPIDDMLYLRIIILHAQANAAKAQAV